METRSRISFVAGNYKKLQGLRGVPIGVCLIVVAVWANTQRGPSRDLSLPLILFAGMALLFFITDRYYRKHFGQVEVSPQKRHLEWWFGALGGGLAMLGFLIDSSALDLPFSTVGLVFAAGAIADFYTMNGSFRGRYLRGNLLAAALVALISLLPLFGLDGWWDWIGMGDQLLGVLLAAGILGVISGVFNHIYLIRSLPLEVDHGRSV